MGVGICVDIFRSATYLSELMGLSISLGSYAVASSIPSDHPRFEAAQHVVKHFESSMEKINAALKEQGIAPHVEPKVLSGPLHARVPLQMRYSTLSLLRGAAYFATYNDDGAPFVSPTDYRADDMTHSHLVYHSDSTGFYVPVDFRTPVYDEDVLGAIIGSSQGLMRDLIEVAPTLGIALRDNTLSGDEVDKLWQSTETASAPFPAERAAWLILFEAARLSLEHRMAIVFS